MIKTNKIPGALNTEEILSLLSKTSQDFKKESEITENISYLFNKKTPKDLALSRQIDHEKNQKPEVNKEIEKKEEIKEKKKKKLLKKKK